MDKFLKFLFYSFLFFLAFGLFVFFSYILFVENNLKYLGLGMFFLKNVFLISLLLVLPFLFAYFLFFVRTTLIKGYYWYKAELNEAIISRIKILDFFVSVLLTVFILLNSKYFFLVSHLVEFGSFSFEKLADNPFLIKLFVVLVFYITLSYFWLVLPVFVFSHRAYHVRFLPLRIVPHKFSLIVSLFFLLLLLIIAFVVFVISVDSFLELENRFLFQLGVVSSVLLIVIAFFAFFRLLFNKIISTVWFYVVGLPNVLVVIFYFLNVNIDVRVFSSLVLENFFSKIRNSPYVLRFESKKFYSDKFNLVSLKKLITTNLVFREISDYTFTIEYSRNIRGFEKVFYSLYTGKLDTIFIKDVRITNSLTKEDFEALFPYSRIDLLSYVDTNYVLISYIYEFGGMEFFYRGGVIEIYRKPSYSDLDGVIAKFYRDLPSFFVGELSPKDRVIIRMVMNKLGVDSLKYRYFVQVSEGYFLVPLSSYCLVISNGNYILYDAEQFVGGNEYPLVVGNAVIALSNFYVDDRLVGFKARYFDLVGYGATLGEAISSMIGNADYYYKVQDLERKLKSLLSVIEENSNKIDPLVIKSIMSILPE